MPQQQYPMPSFEETQSRFKQFEKHKKRLFKLPSEKALRNQEIYESYLALADEDTVGSLTLSSSMDSCGSSSCSTASTACWTSLTYDSSACSNVWSSWSSDSNDEAKTYNYNGWVLYRGGVYSYNQDILYVIVDDSVQSIPDKCFYGCMSLRAVFMVKDGTLRTIGNWAFANCFALQHVSTLPMDVFKKFKQAFVPTILSDKCIKRKRPWK